MNKKRFLAALLASMLILPQTFSVFAEPESEPDTAEEATVEVFEDPTVFPEPRANAAILFDLDGNRVLYERNSNERIYPASVTKIMTALIALEKGNLSDMVTVSDNALAYITYLHSKINLKAGEEISLDNLLIALMVSSANDAANVIAEHIAGDVQSFVALMNERAAELGMTGTHFVNPHGFHDDNHYTTAHDMELVTRKALENEKFCELIKIKTYRMPATNMSDERMLSTTNHLISKYRNTAHYYQYANGVKTGSTEEAGNCLVATAERNGIRLLSLLFGCDNADQKEGAYSFVDTTKMFEHVFNNYKRVTIATTSDIVSDSKVYEAKDNTRVALSPSKDIKVLMPKDYTDESITTDIKLNEEISAPIAKGVSLGSATYSFAESFGGKPYHLTVDLLAVNDVKRDHFLHFLHGLANFFLSPFVLIPLLAIAALYIFGTINKARRRKARRRKMKSHHQSRTGYSSSSGARRRTTGGSYGTSSTRRRTTSSSSARRRPANHPGRTPDPWDKYR